MKWNMIFCLMVIFTNSSCQDSGYKTMDKNELEQKLTPLQYKVTQQNGTEPPFQNKYWDNKKPGIYVDIVSGEPLFSSTDKYDSKSGWPSFTKTLVKENIFKKEDKSFGMKRVEVRSIKADSHLGHLFNDGPAPTGFRYCINSAALRFIPVQELEKEGYGQFKRLFETLNLKKSNKGQGPYKIATFAGGCFWGVEAILNKVEGVIETTVGYTGGQTDNPSYRQVTTGKTGHSEAVQVIFDPDQISYGELLNYFWRLHDPTTLNRQGVDIGTQYRSAIFYHSENQKRAAEKSKADFDASRIFTEKTVTEIVPASTFYRAEEYHQDYFKKNGGIMCHTLRDK